MASARPNEISLDQFITDKQWIHERVDDLRKEYPDQYIAVYCGEIVGSNTQIDSLIEDLQDPFENVIADMAIEFVHKEPPSLIAW